MGISRVELTRTQSSVVRYYKDELKELKKLYKSGENLEEAKVKIDLLERLRKTDYEINNILPIFEEKKLNLKNLEIGILSTKNYYR
jgi:hypothetical protein